MCEWTHMRSLASTLQQNNEKKKKRITSQLYPLTGGFCLLPHCVQTQQINDTEFESFEWVQRDTSTWQWCVCSANLPKFRFIIEIDGMTANTLYLSLMEIMIESGERKAGQVYETTAPLKPKCWPNGPDCLFSVYSVSIFINIQQQCAFQCCCPLSSTHNLEIHRDILF